jgi:rhodanese-related sulfurtransferase
MNIIKKSLILILILISISILIYKNKIKNKKSDDNKIYNNKNILLINVLDKEEFDDAHIINSINVEFKNINNFLLEIKDKNTTLIFYCANYLCTSSHESAELAYKLGFKNIFVYSGGMAEWYQYSKDDPKFKFDGPAELEYLKMITIKRSKQNNRADINIINKTQDKAKYNIIDIYDLHKMLS